MTQPLTANARPGDYVRSGYLGHLNADWVGIAGTFTPPAWASSCALLAETVDIGEVLTAISLAGPTGQDEILHALLTLHHDGDQLAGRVVLQTMLGSVQRLILTARYRQLEDIAACAVEAMWSAIAAYPLRRRVSVAANLSLEALSALQKATEAPLPAGDLLEHQIHQEQLSGRLEGGSAADPAEEAARALAWAYDQGVLDQEEVRLLALTYLSESRPSSAELAAEYGVSDVALRKRQSRAVAKLAAAVSNRLSHPAA